jgi:diaminohydroxyphosphoribosylaminopyrimidine deaminase / 5-amino-6-(5-phosphoribosylamino)uracil reductase
MSNTHQKYMLIALEYAERGIGANPRPNPSVGCVIVKNGRIISAEHTASGGRPHAEKLAILNAIESVEGATAYVTLEPCSHFGKSPPCVDSLIEAKIAKVVIGCIDPNPLVRGGGVARLKEAGIEVEVGILEEYANKIHSAFMKRITKNLPFITLKMAVTCDNKIGFARQKTVQKSGQKTGQKFAISGELANNYVQHLRYKNDAILIGVETLLNDDPMLNCRLAGLEQNSPSRIILDTNLRTPESSKIIQTSGDIETIIFCAVVAPKILGNAKIITVEKDKNGNLNLQQVLTKLAEHGFNSVLVEGGKKVAESFLNEGFVDNLQIIKSPKILGKKAIEGVNFEIFLKDNFKQVIAKNLGEDLLTEFEKI